MRESSIGLPHLSEIIATLKLHPERNRNVRLLPIAFGGDRVTKHREFANTSPAHLTTKKILMRYTCRIFKNYDHGEGTSTEQFLAAYIDLS